MNKMYSRTGPLFESPFKRIVVEDEAYFSRLVTYIHQNPEKHGIIDDYRNYPYSSYHAYLEAEKATKLNKAEVLGWFGDYKGFTASHDLQRKELSSATEDRFDFTH